MEIDAKEWNGVQSLLDNYAKVRSDDYAVVLYTTDSSESAAWVSAALEIRGIQSSRVWMAPLRDNGFLERFRSALPTPSELEGRLLVLGFEKDTMSHFRDVAKVVAAYRNHQVLRTISACPTLFSSALSVSPEDLSARNAAILERLMTGRQLHVTTEGGTDLSITLDPKHRWISNRGIAKQGGTVILPAGEVATFPASINGVFVADFAFNVNAVTDRDCRLSDHPITIWIEDGRAVKYECGNPSTSRFLEECFKTHCAYNVGELGFGTNFAVTDPIPMNSHINERRPGIHLGFGQHNQDPGIVCYQCLIHLDLIARGGIVWIDGDPEPLDLEQVTPSSRAHPSNPRDEDVFSPETQELEVDDCCGILTEEGLRLFSQLGAL